MIDARSIGLHLVVLTQGEALQIRVAGGSLTEMDTASGTLSMGALALSAYPDLTLLFDVDSLHSNQLDLLYDMGQRRAEVTCLISARRSSILHQFILPKTTFRRQSPAPGNEVSTAPNIA